MEQQPQPNPLSNQNSDGNNPDQNIGGHPSSKPGTQPMYQSSSSPSSPPNPNPVPSANPSSTPSSASNSVPTPNPTPASSPAPATNFPKADPNINSQPTGSNNIGGEAVPFNSGNPFQDGSSENTDKMPPPPPKMDERVGIRTMSSDMESIKQSGGELPKSEVVTAHVIKDQSKKQNDFSSDAKQDDINNNPVQNGSGVIPPKNYKEPDASFGSGSIKKSNNIKITFIIVGIIIGAIAIGFGIYYLVHSLGTTPEVDRTNNNQGTNGLPIGNITDNTNNNDNQKNASSTTEDNTSLVDFKHTSIIKSPNDSVIKIINTLGLNNIKSLVSSSTLPVLPTGQVRDISFKYNVSSTTNSLASSQILGLYFPQLSSKLSPLFDEDFTSWIYFDEIGKNKASKFGLVFKLNDNKTIDEASTVVSQIENSLQDVANLFVDDVSLPINTIFNDGVIDEVPIRFLQFSTGNVFEYGFIDTDFGNYLIMSTSYKQMVDIINRFKTVN